MHVIAITDIQLLLTEIHKINDAIAGATGLMAAGAPSPFADQLTLISKAARAAADLAAAAEQTTT